MWIKKLKLNGGNSFALGMTPYGFSIEWEKINNYSKGMSNAWELDQVLNLAASENIFIAFTFDFHDQFMSDKKLGWNHSRTGWDDNPYHSKNQNFDTTIKTSLDFFKNTNAIKYYKHKVRYIIARWGYSTHILYWEILTEIDNALTDHDYNNNTLTRKIFKNWFRIITGYIKNDLQDPHPVAGSFSVGETDDIPSGIFDIADISLIHKYGESKTDNYYPRSEKVEKLHKHSLTKNKPVLFDEIGGPPALDFCTDIEFHTNIWATSFTGSFGCGWNWWWDNAIFPNGYEINFKSLAAFFQNEQLSKESYSPQKYKNARSFKKSEVESFFLVNGSKTKVLGWLHNISYHWYNLQNNTCIDSLLINNSGKHFDKGDTKEYKIIAEKNSAEGHFTEYAGMEIKIYGLNKRSNYSLEWFSTTEKGGSTEITETIRTNGRGIAVIKVPEKLSEYGDAAFKIKQLPRVNF